VETNTKEAVMTGTSLVAGVDGSPTSEIAVRWAAREAQARGLPLHPVHAYISPAIVTTGFAPVALPADDEAGLAEAHRLLDAAAAVAAAAAPGVETSGRLVHGATAASALLEHSVDAATVAVGSRGLGGFASMLLGSVAGHVATHARCPVAVVRGEWATPGLPVVVGVDGSQLSMRAVEAAFGAASWRGAPLVAVQVLPTAHASRSLRDDDWHTRAEEARACLSRRAGDEAHHLDRVPRGLPPGVP
jgi:nucleotide-binding universal stress UspA family protein